MTPPTADAIPAAQAAGIVNAAGVSKAYQKHPALKDVSVTAHAGRTFGLIGLNGAGKTTLIKCLLGLARPDSGTITVAGAPAGSQAARRAVAYLPERFLPWPYLTGREYLALTLRQSGHQVSAAETEAWCQRVGLDPAALARRVKGYSKGMGQKLGLLSVLLAPAPVLVLDEPMSGLDPLARHQLVQTLAHVRAAGRTLILSSHLLHDLDHLCDDVAVLHLGTRRFLGTPAALKLAHGADTLDTAFLRCIGVEDRAPLVA